MESPSSLTSAHSVPTDGRARPVSICDSIPGETPTSAASARSVVPRASRASRIRAPTVRVSASSGVSGASLTR